VSFLRVLRISHSSNVSAYRERDRKLEQLGVEVALICPSDWEHLGQSDRNIKESFSVDQIRTLGTGAIPLFAYDLGPIIERIRKFRPDVIDIHEEPYSVSCFECLVLAKTFAPRAAYVFYTAQNINKKYPLPFRMSEGFVYQNSHGAYPCSIGVQEVLQAKGYAKRCPVIPLGVDPQQFSPQGETIRDWKHNNDSQVIGFTGRLVESKGLQVILQAMALLPHSVKSTVKLLVAGSGPSQAKLSELATNLGLADYVTWLGALKQTEMPAFYRSCNVVVVPSITTKTWKEQFGRVPVEAMSCGIPIIVSDSGSLPEVAADCGIIVPEDNPTALSAALQELLPNRLRSAEIGRRSGDLVRTRFSWHAVAQLMVQLYSDCLRASQQPHS
jgi:glycosyltransferase involved in cell wall biosynthesis